MKAWTFFPDLKRRYIIPEIMDDPGLNEESHRCALKGLERINRLSLSSQHVWAGVCQLLNIHPGRQMRVLDIACGAGDIPIGLWKKSVEMGVRLEIEACDRSVRAVEFAQNRARAAGANIRFFVCDVLTDSLPQTYDIVTSSLFLHHLETTQAVTLLRRMGEHTREMILINDLVRSRGGWLLACLATRMLSSSYVVHNDGPQSVLAAFTVPEIGEAADEAGLGGYQIERRWPCRFVLNWRRSL